MGMFLNSSVPYESYKEVLLDKYFVDKSMLLDGLMGFQIRKLTGCTKFIKKKRTSQNLAVRTCVFGTTAIIPL